ncbi:radical SAM protein [Pseudomonas sp. NPDC087817]|uniref:radical SAM protein n=1 Tax=Pseudomonas sp. NPDC087817 TaxID=3364451 RepID=UPI00381B6CFC
MLTSSCNSKCNSCSYWLCEAKHLPMEKISLIANELSKSDIKSIRLTGGEPTSHPHFIEIAKILKSRQNAKIILNTHGHNLIEIFPKIKNYIDGYIISLDGSTRETYKSIRGVDWFDEIVRIPKEIHLFSERIFVGYTCVIQNKNLHELTEILNIGKNSGADMMSFTLPTFSEGVFNNDSGRILKQQRGLWITSEQDVNFKIQLEALKSSRLQNGNNFILQSDGVLDNYFEILKTWREGKAHTLPDHKCHVPKSSVVFSENEQIKPCFMLKAAWALKPDNNLNSENILIFRENFYKAPTPTECKSCYVYPHVMENDI